MKDTLHLYVIIADDNEFAAAKAAAPAPVQDGASFGRESFSFSLAQEGRRAEVTAVYSRVGKVNAAACAAFAVASGADYILNAGLSGGISHIGKGELMLATRFFEHDFDLTPLGYKKCEKPGQGGELTSCPALDRLFLNACPRLKCGAAATGDCFVCDDRLRRELAERHGAMSCDMESAAIASVCADAGVGFSSLRKISDDAGQDAGIDYQDAKNQAERSLFSCFFAGVSNVFKADALWD